VNASHPIHLVLGLILWAIWFVAIYGGLSVGCQVAPPVAEQGALTWLNAALLLFTLVTVLVLLVFAWLCRRARGATDDHTGRFVTGVAAGVYLAAAVITLVIGLPVIALPPCI
jgi:heme/copper-type cytochrome/quinol oxidase subunit 2